MTHLDTWCADPGRAQRSALRAILGANAQTAFCRAHGLTASSTPADFARRVPMTTYEGHRPWIDRMRHGERGVLVSDDVRYFARTSGTSADPKHVPITRAWLAAMQRAQRIVHEGILRDVPAAADRPFFVLSSPIAEGSVTGLGLVEAGLRHGVIVGPSAGDTGRRSAREVVRGVASDVARTRPAVLAAASPSALVLLLDAVAERRDGAEVLADVVVIAAWCSGASSLHLAGLRRRVPHARVRDIGLAATEGYFTVSTDGTTAAVPMASDHLFELVPEDRSEPIPLEAAENGRSYRLVVTTPGGLYRYDTEDVVKVVGTRMRMPLLAFSHRAGGVSSVTGEKLTESQLVLAVEGATSDRGLVVRDFSTEVVWSDDDPRRPSYRTRLLLDPSSLPLRVEGLSGLAAAIDARLCVANIEYGRKRETSRLGMHTVELAQGPLSRSGDARIAHQKLVPLRVIEKGMS